LGVILHSSVILHCGRLHVTGCNSTSMSLHQCFSILSLQRNPFPQFLLFPESTGSSLASNLSWAHSILMPEDLKFATEGLERGTGSWRASSEPPSHDLWSLGECCKLPQRGLGRSLAPHPQRGLGRSLSRKCSLDAQEPENVSSGHKCR